MKVFEMEKLYFNTRIAKKPKIYNSNEAEESISSELVFFRSIRQIKLYDIHHFNDKPSMPTSDGLGVEVIWRKY